MKKNEMGNLPCKSETKYIYKIVDKYLKGRNHFDT